MSTSHLCPRCGTGNYESQRALSVHLNSCREPFLSHMSSQKRSHAHPTLAQRADILLREMKRPHISGIQPMVNRLSVNPSISTIASALTTTQSEVNNDSTCQDYNDDGHYDVSFDNVNNLSDEPQTQPVSEQYNFRRNINPPWCQVWYSFRTHSILAPRCRSQAIRRNHRSYPPLRNHTGYGLSHHKIVSPKAID